MKTKPGFDFPILTTDEAASLLYRESNRKHGPAKAAEIVVAARVAVRPYVLTRTVTRRECPWLDATIRKGTKVYMFSGHTHGCITPMGFPFTASREADSEFFELPRSAVARWTPRNA